MVWSVMNSLHDHFDVMFLISCVNTHENYEQKSEARFLSKPVGRGRLVSPDHHFSAFANSQNFSKNEERYGCQCLEDVIKLKLILCDILWTSWSLLLSCIVVRMVWMMTMVTSMDHLIGAFTSSHHLVEGYGHTEETDENEGIRGNFDSLLILLNIGLGSLQLLDSWVNWRLLQEIWLLIRSNLSLWSYMSCMALQEHRHVIVILHF